MPETPGLPIGVHDRAMQRQLALHETRITTMYNRHRALFAESIVAELLPGATEVVNPSAAWDIDWPVGDRTVRVQVKCSGSFLPAHADRTKGSPAKWDLKEPTKGWPSDFSEQLGPGHHCDVFVLVRHEGSEVSDGWRFAVLRPDQITGRYVGARWLDRQSIVMVAPTDLADTVRSVAPT